MNKYSKIIREEINRLILRETLDVSPLSKYIQPLKKNVSDISNIGTTQNKEVDTFLNDLNTYVLQIIFGIDRCVKANSLNEGLEAYGIQYPAELGGNLWNDFESGFVRGGNWAQRQFRSKGNNAKYDNGNGNNTQTNAADDPNNVPTVRLEESLNNLAQISLRYQDIANKYPNIVSQYSGILFETFDNISKLNTEFKQIKNAQGVNP